MIAIRTTLLLIGLLTAPLCAETKKLATDSRYEMRAEHDPNGIGKFYMGREIALVMGHEGAEWLERPEREREERSDLLLPALKLKPGDAVADIGCGSGYYTRRLAKAVGRAGSPLPAARTNANDVAHGVPRPTEGIVYAVEIQQEMLDLLTNKLAAEKIFNVKPVLGTITDPKLPRASVDLILMVDVYHEFDHPFEMVAAMCQSLKPGGRIVFVEFRGEDPNVPIKLVHKMTEAQVRKEMNIHPLDWVETIGTLPQQHIIVFRKRL
ncbi:MAG: class I SAM-dependent methyltransferase [Verrucomicrobiota bacterium]